MEGAYFKASGNLLDFSEQQLIDCVTNCNGCNGGLGVIGLEYLQTHGLETE